MDVERLFRILREEYGIETEAQLDEALRNLGPLDITRFCQRKEVTKAK